jgi:hypothetical protein
MKIKWSNMSTFKLIIASVTGQLVVLKSHVRVVTQTEINHCFVRYTLSPSKQT